MNGKVNNDCSPQSSMITACPIVDLQGILEINHQDNTRSNQKSKRLKININHSSKTIVGRVGHVRTKEDHQRGEDTMKHTFQQDSFVKEYIALTERVAQRIRSNIPLHFSHKIHFYLQMRFIQRVIIIHILPMKSKNQRI